MWYPTHERSTCHQVPSSRRLLERETNKAKRGRVGYYVTSVLSPGFDHRVDK